MGFSDERIDREGLGRVTSSQQRGWGEMARTCGKPVRIRREPVAVTGDDCAKYHWPD